MFYPHKIDSISLGFASKLQLGSYIEKNKPFIYEKLHEVGAILFRGFNINSSSDFEEVVKFFDKGLKNYIGGDSPRDKISEKIYTSTNYPPEATISMHHEKSYSNNYPRYIYFFCEIPSTIGGETPILDSRKIYNLLDKTIINNFTEKKLKYIMNLHNGLGFGKSWQEAFEVNDKEQLEKILDDLGLTYFWKPDSLLCVEEIVSPIIHHPVTGETIFFSQAHQWHPSSLGAEVLSAMKTIIPEENFFHNCTYGDNSKIDIEDLDQIRQIIKSQQKTFQWKKGDFLMLDNIISMHGRMPFQGERKILVAMS